jgi:para-nitrobenzyl esterase
MLAVGLSHRIRIALVIIILTFASLLTGSANASRQPRAMTESGVVLGRNIGGVNNFLGIPYAAPPVGPLRWQPPQPYGNFPGLMLDATAFGSECIQSGGGNEDCLFLNVYQPANHPAHRLLPVMVWIHGGALVSGAASIYDPSSLARLGVIVVTINYRLGYLGFLAQSALDAEGHDAGNYGLMDQQFALNWVQSNIAGFGGDPNKVTLFGESAGGQSVLAHLASPTAAHLFRGAIAESGTYLEFQDYFDFIVALGSGETTGTSQVASGAAVADAVGCSDQTAACLRAVPATSFPAIQPSTIFPFVDGTLLPATPAAAFTSGHINQVPVIIGTNHDEWRFFVAEEYDLGALGPLTDTEYADAVAALEEQPVDSPMVQMLINTLYPLSDFPPPTASVMSAPLALGALGTDDIFTCPARNAELLLAQAVPTWVYEFHVAGTLSLLPPVSFPLGDAHGFELAYLFALEGMNPRTLFTRAQVTLSNTMMRYWTQFAKTLNPNFAGGPKWSTYASGGSIESLVAPKPIKESDAAFDADHKCSSYWDTF